MPVPKKEAGIRFLSIPPHTGINVICQVNVQSARPSLCL